MFQGCAAWAAGRRCRNAPITGSSWQTSTRPRSQQNQVPTTELPNKGGQWPQMLTCCSLTFTNLQLLVCALRVPALWKSTELLTGLHMDTERLCQPGDTGLKHQQHSPSLLMLTPKISASVQAGLVSLIEKLNFGKKVLSRTGSLNYSRWSDIG